MEAIAPSGEFLEVLRAISRAGFGYEQTKELASAAGWKLVDDELDLGYVAFEWRLGTGDDNRRRLSVWVKKGGGRPWAFVPLFYFNDYDQVREPFDQAYQSLAEQLASLLGTPSSSGEHCYAHRNGWPYACSRWVLPDVVLDLVQDEFDIQFGMDVTLWVLPASQASEFPTRYPPR